MLHTALPEDILAGKVTDVYFQRTRQILEKLGRPARVVAEFILKKFPPWIQMGNFCRSRRGAHRFYEIAGDGARVARGLAIL